MTAPVTPWYRQAWPWFLISLPAAAVLGGIVTFYLAARGWDGPVVHDYYRQGLAINEELTRTTRARELGIEARLTIGGLDSGQRLRVEITAAQPLPPEAALRVRLVHPGRRGADRVAVLARIDAGVDGRSATYAGEWQQAEPDPRLAAKAVAWQTVVETQQWRLDDIVSADGPAEATLRAR